MEDRKLLEYEIPRVINYTDEEILDELGPAQAYEYPLFKCESIFACI